ICVAYANLTTKPASLLDVRYTFAGMAGIFDPPRPEVKAAVADCKRAGIKPVMITGDHLDTAVAIAKQIGLFLPNGSAYTQTELEKLSPEEQSKAIVNCSVFARTTPQFKLKIVDEYQKHGDVVAMTGDGVNDAPALKKADIGCAMGICGTDVAKEACDIILTDDNFATIVGAVEYGRSIYANIRKAVHFLISCNIGEIFVVFAAIMLSLPAPLAAIQLLWVNLVTDSLPAIAFAFEKPARDIMSQKPIKKQNSLFSKGETLLMPLEGLLIGSLSLAAYFIGENSGGFVVGRTMSFAV
ncbi:MAG: cation-translocating P-type ATPase, partial [Clostridia bacterium]